MTFYLVAPAIDLSLEIPVTDEVALALLPKRGRDTPTTSPSQEVRPRPSEYIVLRALHHRHGPARPSNSRPLLWPQNLRAWKSTPDRAPLHLYV